MVFILKTIGNKLIQAAVLIIVVLSVMIAWPYLKTAWSDVNLARATTEQLRVLEDAARQVSQDLDTAKSELEGLRKEYSFWKKVYDHVPFLSDTEIGKRISRASRRIGELEKKKSEIEEQLSTAKQQLNELPEGLWLSVNVPKAATIVLLVLLAPSLCRVFLFFVIAPFARYAKGLRFNDEVCNSDDVDFSSSRTDLKITVSDKETAFLRSRFLQVSDVAYRYRSRWWLPGCLFASIAARLGTLQQINYEGNAKDRPPELTIGGRDERDDTIEFAVLSIPSGCAVVCHPRCIAGIVTAGKSIDIAVKWRFCNLQAWLTLQLRYYVFRGPCRLILHGLRGIRFEHVGRSGRLVGQSATRGFTTDVQYSSQRSETFGAYFTGADDLFNDRFDGQNGIYFYEQVPSRNRDSIKGFLSGVFDTVLKVFGI